MPSTIEKYCNDNLTAFMIVLNYAFSLFCIKFVLSIKNYKLCYSILQRQHPPYSTNPTPHKLYPPQTLPPLRTSTQLAIVSNTNTTPTPPTLPPPTNPILYTPLGTSIQFAAVVKYLKLSLASRITPYSGKTLAYPLSWTL